MTNTKTFTRRGLRGLHILAEDVGGDDLTLTAFFAIEAIAGFGVAGLIDMRDGRVLATGALPSEL